MSGPEITDALYAALVGIGHAATEGEIARAAMEVHGNDQVDSFARYARYLTYSGRSDGERVVQSGKKFALAKWTNAGTSSAAQVNALQARIAELEAAAAGKAKG